MRTSPVSEAIKQFFKTTTLHGFKYLYPAYFADRVCWLFCCCASACCAGVLCAVLWERFLEVPALLTLRDYTNSDAFMVEKIPAVIVCPPTESISEMFLHRLSPNKTATQRIPVTLARLLAGKSTARDQLVLLDDLLIANNLTLPQLMMDYTPNCNQHTKRCRYQQFTVPCEQLFEKQLTVWGVCCVMTPKKIKSLPQHVLAETQSAEEFEFVLQCTHGSTLYGCQLTTMYESEEYIQPNLLLPGNYYRAQLRFVAIPENPAAENLLEQACVSQKGYSRSFCLIKCAEKSCGCSDPFHSVVNLGVATLPKCSVPRMGCLRTSEYKSNLSCTCLPSCKKVTSFLVLESAEMNLVSQSIDPFHSGINVSASIIIHLRVNVGHSRIFVLNPTETWLTLLSSLGGVFNMFLGVGLFSALEFLFLILIKIPIALKKSSEIDPTTAYTSPVVR